MKRKPLILCADDSASVLQAWKTFLERNGYEVLTAIDGTKAVQLFGAHPVDLVLLDYHMPQMNGDVAAAHMRACKTNVPIALLSADDMPRLGEIKSVDALVSKSEPITHLLEIVDHLLRFRLLFQPLEEWETDDAA